MFCKNCGAFLDSENIVKDDSRFCYSCYQVRGEFVRGRKVVLANLSSLPLEAKIIKTNRLIQEAIDEFGIERVYISYSGGKDSTVLSHIAKSLYPKIQHLFANTTNEYPETLSHINWESNSNNTNITIVNPIDSSGNWWNFRRVVDIYGYPMFSKKVSNAIRTYQHALSDDTKHHALEYIHRNFKKYEPYMNFKISDMCCDKLKKAPLKRRAKELGLECSILGILASESRQRELDWIDNGCNVFYKRKDNQCRPLSFWTTSDIDHYIEKYNVKISDLYAMGYTRNGCMYCGFGVNLEVGENRYQKLSKTHPRAYNYLVSNYHNILDDCDVRY